jgi:hypothetical protein
MKFTMPIDKIVATRAGHTIDFKAGVPTHVPKEAWREVQASGAVPEDQEAVQMTRRAAVMDAVIVDDPVERRNRIFKAFTDMVERNKRGDFGASGAPHQKVVESIVGFEITAQERDSLWVEFQQLSAEGGSTETEATSTLVQEQEAEREVAAAKPKADNTPAADKKVAKRAKAKA